MFRTRMLFIGCALVSAVACVDHVIGPTGSPNQGNGGSGGGVTSLQTIQGVVEQVDDDRFGLRQPDRLVMIRFSDREALMQLVGREVILSGRFDEDGEFTVSTLQLAPDSDDGGDALFRMPAPRAVTGKTGLKR